MAVQVGSFHFLEGRTRRVPDHEDPCPIQHAINAVASQDHQPSGISVGAMRRGIAPAKFEGPTTRPRWSYSCFVLERRNSAIMLPKLYIVPLDELLGIFHRGLIVGAHKSNCSADKTVFVHDVSSVLGHIGVTPKSLSDHINPEPSVRFRILKP
jgi:hypothetical protein